MVQKGKEKVVNFFLSEILTDIFLKPRLLSFDKFRLTALNKALNIYGKFQS